MPGRSGPAALLALFLAVLLGVPAPAASLAAASPAGVKQLQSGKATALARPGRRAPENQADSTDDPPLALGMAPAVETDCLSRRPSGGTRAVPAMAPSEPRPAPYRARAPPAA
jgi:hypothetical protein